MFFILNLISMSIICADQVILPRFIVHPRSQVCKHGSSVQLVCETNLPTEEQEIIWLLNTAPISRQIGDIEISKNELTIKSFDPDLHLGSYTCMARTRYGYIRSHDAVINSIDNEQSDKLIVVNEVSAVVGSLLALSCSLPRSVINENDGKIIWMTPRGRIIDDTDRHRLTQYHLYITKVHISDAGLYQCAFQRNDNRLINSTTKFIVRSQTVKNAKSKASLKSNQIVEPPQAVRVVASRNLTLECGIQSEKSDHTIVWEKFGVSLSTTRVEIDSKVGILRIRNLTVDDRGTYICKIHRHGNGSPLMYKTLVEVEEQPRIEGSDKGQDVYLSSRTDVNLLCPATGKPLPSITWYFNGQKINDTTSMRVEGQVLLISSVTHNEEGIYQCVAQNIHGQASKIFLISLQLLNGAFGTDSSGGQSDGTAHMSTNRRKTFADLTQWNGDNHMDIFGYGMNDQATSKNKASKKVANKHLKATNDEIMVKTKPIIVSGPENSTSTVGETIVLTCVVEADGHLLIRWLHNGRQLSNSQTGPGRLDSTGATGSLRIYDARTSDSGLYTCVVDTEFGSVRAAGFVDVVNPLDTELSKPSSNQQKTDQLPTDAFVKKSNKEEQETLHKQMKIHARRPASVHPMAIANDGQVRVALTDITNLGPDEGIALKWDVVQGSGTVDYFRILYRTQHTSPGDQSGADEYFILDESLSSDVRSYIVDSLKPAITYNFKVEAVSKLGHQYASNSKDFMLPGNINGKLAKTTSQIGVRDRKSRSLSPPVILEIWEMPNKDTKLDVALKWKMRNNQQIDGFRIHYKVLSDSSADTAEEVRVPVGPERAQNPSIGQRVFTHLIKGLSYSKEYEFRICAYNKHQSSDLSNVVSIFKSDDGAESVIHIQDASSLVSERLSMLDSGIGDISPGLSDKRSPRLLDHTVRTNHYITSPHHQHQTMLLYTSLAIAIVSLLLLLFTATLVFMLRHFRRRQRRFRAIHHPYAESLCSFESKHPCLAASSKKPYSSNCTECCCENISNSSVANGGKMLPGLQHLFSLGRVSHVPAAFNNSTAARFISGPTINPGIIDQRCSSNQRCSGSESYEQTYNIMHHRCSCCRAIIDNLGRIGGCPIHHLAMRPPLMPSKSGNFDASTAGDEDPRNNGIQLVDTARGDHSSAGSQDRGPSPRDTPNRNEQPSLQENFYHTLTETPVPPRLVSPSPDLIPSPPCLRNNACSKTSALVCQCCGQLAGST